MILFSKMGLVPNVATELFFLFFFFFKRKGQ